jgi:Ni,Fe-hydrogenase I small subunit
MKKQEELPFEEEMFKIFGKQSGKNFLKKNQSSL